MKDWHEAKLRYVQRKIYLHHLEMLRNHGISNSEIETFPVLTSSIYGARYSISADERNMKKEKIIMYLNVLMIIHCL